MKAQQKQVLDFMLMAGQATPAKPTIPSVEVMRLRHELIQEELDELLIKGFGDPDNLMQVPSEPNLVEIADAIADLLVVVLGTAVACGINITPIFDEVHRSNMSKFIDGYRSPSGKWIKGPSYSPANIAPLIEAQQ